MSFKDCINQAVNDGRLREKAAEEALELFDEIDMELRNSMAEDAAQIEAGRRAYQALAYEKAETKRRDLLKIRRWQEINKNMREYRNGRGEQDPARAMLAHLEGDEFAQFSNIDSRYHAVLGRLHSQMDNVLATFRRDLLGRPRQKATLDNMVREAFGEDTGVAAAKELNEAWQKAAETARKRFNAAGGRIPKRENWGLPQEHDSTNVRSVSFKEWRDFIVPRLDHSKMVDEATGQPFTREKLETALRDVYETIRTDGLNKVRANGQPGGKAVANRRADSRFLVFKDADSWMQYNEKFGSQDPFSVMLTHLDHMARDIGAMEILGPNPTASLRFMDQIVRKSQSGGDPSLIDKASRASKLAWDMYGHHRGGMNAPIDSRVGRTFSGLRQFLQSAQLGAATLSAITDINYQRIARQHAGLREAKAMKDITKILKPGSIEDQRMAVRLGLIAENWSSQAMAQARYVGDVTGPEISRRVADFVMRASGLSPWTQAGRWAFGMEFMGKLADDAGKTFDQLHPDLQKTMRKHGIDSDRWDVMRATNKYEYEGAQFLRPEDIAGRSDIGPDYADELAMQMLEMVQQETEFAVPSVSLRGKARMLGETRPGSIQGEMLRSFAMYKSFPVTLMHTHVARMMAKKGLKSKGRYGANLVISTTLMGGLALQLKEISKGRDPRPMTGEKGPEFWGAALLQGGGLGIFGDFLFSNVNRFGTGLAETTAGPVIEFIDDTRNLTIGNLSELARGEDTDIGSDAVSFMRRYTPGGSLWYARLGYERLILDELQKTLDPDAKARMRRLQRRYQRDYEQKYWWRPGETAPDRAPDFENAVEAN